jgi:hypothetical protein
VWLALSHWRAIIPLWVWKSLHAHTSDTRPMLVMPADIAEARTNDRLWNSIQGKLRLDGFINEVLLFLLSKLQ